MAQGEPDAFPARTDGRLPRHAEGVHNHRGAGTGCPPLRAPLGFVDIAPGTTRGRAKADQVARGRRPTRPALRDTRSNPRVARDARPDRPTARWPGACRSY